MKYLILLAVVVGVLWMLRSWRKPSIPTRPQTPQVGNEDMVACAHCGMHLPSSEALPGRGGVFCGEAHRSAYERTRGD